MADPMSSEVVRLLGEVARLEDRLEAGERTLRRAKLGAEQALALLQTVIHSDNVFHARAVAEQARVRFERHVAELEQMLVT